VVEIKQNLSNVIVCLISVANLSNCSVSSNLISFYQSAVKPYIFIFFMMFVASDIIDQIKFISSHFVKSLQANLANSEFCILNLLSCT